MKIKGKVEIQKQIFSTNLTCDNHTKLKHLKL